MKIKHFFFFAAMMLSSIGAFAQFSGSGSGTESDPYKIFYADQLNQVRNFTNQVGVTFKLMNDIDLTDWMVNNNPGQGWEPIGVESSPFKGVFDGNGKTLSGFTISRTTNYVGLFGYIDGATVKDLTMAGSVKGGSFTGAFVGYSIGSGYLQGLVFNGNVSGSNYTGGIVGHNSHPITNVEITGDVSGIKYVGGIAGYTTGSIIGATTTGNVIGTSSYVGGIVGNSNSNISNTTIIGNVSGTSYLGGICGCSIGESTISNCRITGDANGTTYVGGIIGDGQSSTITNCYSYGNVTGDEYVGGVIGSGFSNVSCCSSFGDVNGVSYVGGVIGGINNGEEEIPEFKYVYKYWKETKYIAGDEVSDYHSSSASDILKTGTIISRSINGCCAIGNVIATGNYVGGICGYYKKCTSWSKTENGSIYLSSSNISHYVRIKGVQTTTTGSFTTYNYTPNQYSYILTDNYFSGNLTGKDYVSGITGYGDGVTIMQNYANANITGVNYVGGIVARIVSECCQAKYYPSNSSSPVSVNATSNASVLKSNMALNASLIGSNNVGRIYGSRGSDNITIGVNGNASEDNRALYDCALIINGVTQELTDNEQNGVSNGAAYFKLKANYVSHGWDFNNNWTNQETETYPYKPWQAAPPIITSALVSGDESITGKSTDGGTVYIKIGSAEEQSVICSGTTFTLTGIASLKSGTEVLLYTKTSDKEASYINHYTVGYPGSGTEADPWRVYSAEDIQGIYKAGYYKQMNDIDLTSWINKNNSTEGWIPVGYSGNDAIIYDGGNHKVSGLWVNTPTKDFVGLFSSIYNCTIKDLTIEASSKQVKGNNYTALLIGQIAGSGTIENVTVKGNVIASGVYAGGIIGYSRSLIKNCTSTATVKSTGSDAYVGGIVGYSTQQVSGCQAKCTITASGQRCYVGGLVGKCEGCITKCMAEVNMRASGTNSRVGGLIANNSNTITLCSTSGSVISTGTNSYVGAMIAENRGNTTDCYSTATTTGTQYTAALIGYNYGAVNRCYASGNVSSTYYGAGLVGYNSGVSAVVTNCVALGSKVEVSDQNGWGIRVIGGYTNGAPDPDESNYAWSSMQISVNGVPKTIQDNILDGQSLSDIEIKQQSSYEALYWDFSEVWTMSADGYPVLKWQTEASEAEVTKGDLSGDGKVSITDIVMIIDVIAGTITDANKVAAADVNGDGNVSITDCVAAIDLIAAQASTPSSARRKANAMLSDTDFITAAMQENVLNISLAGERRYTAFQMTVSVPEGMTLGRATMDKMRGADHLVTVRDLGRGQYLVAGFSADNEELMASSGQLLSIITEGQADADIVISDIEFATTQAEAYYLADVAVSGTPTGIKAIENGKLKIENGVYDLQGRRVTKATKGIYIYNGKKTIIK